MKTISNEGLKLIKSFEGCHLSAYDDLQPRTILSQSIKIIGTLTIGWGHTGNVSIGQTITQDEADKLLVNDLSRFVDYVNNPNYVPLTNQLNQYQFDALVSFAYNCGQGNLKQLCTNRTIAQIPVNMLLYNKSKGTVLAGLVRRREAEKQLFEKAVDNMFEQDNAKQIVELKNQINQLEGIVKDVIIALTKVSDSLAQTEPPEWFKKEFPNAVDLLNQKTGTAEFWRAFAVTLRIIQK